MTDSSRKPSGRGLKALPTAGSCRRIGFDVEFRNLNARDWLGRREFPAAHTPTDDERETRLKYVIDAAVPVDEFPS